MPYPKRLIEVDLPIKRISAHARKEKSQHLGHISSMHIWWARRPLASCRAVLCSSLWPDPADPICPSNFIHIAKQEMMKWGQTNYLGLLSEQSYTNFKKVNHNKELVNDAKFLRTLLFDFIADFANWENSLKPEYLETARNLTKTANDALNSIRDSGPVVTDPFAGGGAIPLEALRIGADVFSSDLNPLPILLNKVILEYIPKHGNELVDQIKHSAKEIRDSLKFEISEFYGSENNTEKRQVFFWARTINCEGPNCGYRFPLLRSLWICKKPKKKVTVRLVKNEATKEVDIIIDSDSNSKVGDGTSKLGSATCPVCGFTTHVERVRFQLSSRNGGANDAKFFAVGITGSGQGKTYREPSLDELNSFKKAIAYYEILKTKKFKGQSYIPSEELNHLRGFFNVVLYGMKSWGDLFHLRQAILITKLCEITQNHYEALKVKNPTIAEAVITCLSLIIGKVAQYNSSCCRWKPTGETLIDMFGRQAIPMVWDFIEAYPFCETTGDFSQYVDSFCSVIENLDKANMSTGTVVQASATNHYLPDDSVDAFVTDPPYYDAIPYADLSDFFYVWFRRLLSTVHPILFDKTLSPKDDECVTLSHRAAMYRNKDRKFFENMMTLALKEALRYTKPNGIGVVIFANKSTNGWEAMLSALIEAGWIVTASWPIDTEMSSRLRAQDSAALASSVHLVCRPREYEDGTLIENQIGDWRDVQEELPKRIHEWMPRLAEEGVAGADAIFACLGPALEIFSRYTKVVQAGSERVISLREYLEKVWAAVSQEALNMVFRGGDAQSLEEDARLTAMWLWTLTAGVSDSGSINEDNEDTDEEETSGNGKLTSGFTLEYDTARKIAQGLGANLEDLKTLIEVKGDKARLLPVMERADKLFGASGMQQQPTKKKKKSQLSLTFENVEPEENLKFEMPELKMEQTGKTVLDRLHQAMLLFSAGRNEALKRFLVEDGAGKDDRFWKLAQSLTSLYPKETDERRWVEAVQTYKKSLGF